MYRYAQIDKQTGVCISVSNLSSEVVAEHMIPLSSNADVQPGDIWDGEAWTRLDPLPPEPERLTQWKTKILRLLGHKSDSTRLNRNRPNSY